MQNTRLTIITNSSLLIVERWFLNPWRRTSLYLISPLLGFFLASVISTIAGTAAVFDPLISGIMLVITEVISMTMYRRSIEKDRRSLFWQCLNLLKIGLIYGFFLEAFKLGS
jgi:positive regulator of sigma E activity